MRYIAYGLAIGAARSASRRAGNETAAAKAKRAERHDDDELQQLAHRTNLGSFAILTAIRRA